MRTVLCLVFVTALGCTTSALPAQTYDIANYFLLTNNAWRVDEERRAGTTIMVSKVAVLVQHKGAFIYRHRFERIGPSNWILDDIEKLKLTNTHLEIHEYSNPITNSLTVFNPPIAIPRFLKLNVAATLETTMKENTKSSTLSMSVRLTHEKLTKTTKAGTFAACVRLKASGISNTDAWISSEIRAPGFGIISTIEVDLDETEPEPQMADDEFSDSEQFGILPALPDLR